MNNIWKVVFLDFDLFFGFCCFVFSCDIEMMLDFIKLFFVFCELFVWFFDKLDRIVVFDDWLLDFFGWIFMIFVFLICLIIVIVIIMYRIVIVIILDRVKKKVIF